MLFGGAGVELGLKEIPFSGKRSLAPANIHQLKTAANFAKLRNLSYAKLLEQLIIDGYTVVVGRVMFVDTEYYKTNGMYMSGRPHRL